MNKNKEWEFDKTIRINIEEGKNSNFKVLFIGNSITYHAANKALGWHFNHGMAASSKSKDYVHLIKTKLKKKYPRLSIATINGIKWERGYNKEKNFDSIISFIKDYKPSIIVFRLGENLNKDLFNKYDIYKAIKQTITRIYKINKKIVMSNIFWPNPAIDKPLYKVAKEYKLPFASINDLGIQDRYLAKGLFKHQGVCMHPNDLGMKVIANRIYKELIKLI